MAIYIFGYGSIVNLDNLQSFLGRDVHQWQPAALHGFIRAWSVSMNNAPFAGMRKRYRDAHTGAWFDGYPTFMNIEPSHTHHVNGILFPVTEAELARFDAREVRYDRIQVEVTASQSLLATDVVYAYIGKPDACALYREGKENGRAVISQSYYDIVISAFERHGDAFRDAFFQTTKEISVPIYPLVLEKVVE